MATALVQQASTAQLIGGGATTTINVTLGSTPSSSSWIVAFLGAVDTGGSGSKWTAPAGFTVVDFYNSTGLGDLAVAYALSNGSTTSFTFTLTGAAGDAGWGMEAWVGEISGLVGSSPVDVTNSGGLTNGGNTGVSQAVSAGATSVATEMWMAGVYLIRNTSGAAPNTPTATGAWTAQPIVNHVDSFGTTGLIVATDPVTSTGSPSTTVGWTQGVNFQTWCVVTFKGATAATTVPLRPDVTPHSRVDPIRLRPLIERAPNAKPPLSEPGPLRVTVNKALIQQAKVTRTITPRAPALPPPSKRNRVTVNRALIQPAHLTRPRLFPTSPPPAARPHIAQNRAQVQTAHLVRPHVILTVTAPVAPPIPRATVTRNRFSQPSQRVLAGRTPRSPTGNRLVNLN